MEKDTDYILLKQEVDSLKEAVKELKEECKDVKNQVSNLEKQNTRTDVQYDNIMETLKKLTEKTIPDLILQVEELKSKPAKRYESIVSGILGAIFGAIGGAIAALFLK